MQLTPGANSNDVQDAIKKFAVVQFQRGRRWQPSPEEAAADLICDAWSERGATCRASRRPSGQRGLSRRTI